MRTDGEDKAEAFEILEPLYLSPDPVMGVRDFQLLFPTEKQKDGVEEKEVTEDGTENEGEPTENQEQIEE
jgi:hypothetical protein